MSLFVHLRSVFLPDKVRSCASVFSNVSRSVATEDDDGGGGSQKGRQDGSDFTDDGQADMDGEVGGGGVQYVIRYEEDGEMERVLEKQAELIGQFEAEENAQREWEEKFSKNRDSATVHTFPLQI